MSTPPPLSLSRRGSGKNRPMQSPMGPRSKSQTLSLSMDKSYSRHSTASTSTAYSTGSNSPTSNNNINEGKTLPAIEESATTPVATPTPVNPGPELSVKSNAPSPALTPPPQIKFEPVTIPYKGLPLEAALWTFNSHELQDIVSRAIRSSAREKFIRLLNLELLDATLPSELERLESQRLMAQARYRFNVQRRAMLLQAIMAASTRDRDNRAAIEDLASQLSEITSSCDQILEELLQIADQSSQIKSLMEVHWSSALAIALRKLNSSYGKRTGHLNEAKHKVGQLEVQLEDAWKEAERLAKELDELEKSHQAVSSESEDDDADATGTVDLPDEETAVIERAEVVSISSLTRSPTQSPQLSPTRETHVIYPKTMPSLVDLAGTVMPPISPTSPSSDKMITSPVSDSDRAEDADDAKTPMPNDLSFPKPDPETSSLKSTKSGRSAKSGKSAKSTRTADGSGNRLSAVSAARTRSSRISVSSLRTPARKGSTGSRAGAGARRPTLEPPVPDLPKDISSSSPVSKQPSPSSYHNRSSFIDFNVSDDMMNHHGHDDDESRDVSQKSSLADIQIIHSSGNMPPRHKLAVTLDDIDIMPPTPRVAGDIEEVPREKPRLSVDDLRTRKRISRQESSGTGGMIPSIWLNADTPKTPAERVESLMGGRQNSMSAVTQGYGGKPRSYQSKIKSFTKRYSLPGIPNMFNAKGVAKVPPAIVESS